MQNRKKIHHNSHSYYFDTALFECCESSVLRMQHHTKIHHNSHSYYLNTALFECCESSVLRMQHLKNPSQSLYFDTAQKWMRAEQVPFYACRTSRKSITLPRAFILIQHESARVLYKFRPTHTEPRENPSHLPQLLITIYSLFWLRRKSWILPHSKKVLFNDVIDTL